VIAVEDFVAIVAPSNRVIHTASISRVLPLVPRVLLAGLFAIKLEMAEWQA
jgi:hypothetical protein